MGKADADLRAYSIYIQLRPTTTKTQRSDRRFCASLQAIHVQQICWRCTLVFLASTEWFEESHAGGVDQRPCVACLGCSPR